MNVKANSPRRSVTDVGPGDYVKIGSRWEQIQSNTAYGSEPTPRRWTVCTEHGSLWDINLYAKAEDFPNAEGPPHA